MDKEKKHIVTDDIFVGQKPTMNYVTSVVMVFTANKKEKVTIKARGKFVSKAVDIAEIASKRFMEEKIEVDKIEIDSESFKSEEGKTIRVSTIEITLKKK